MRVNIKRNAEMIKTIELDEVRLLMKLIHSRMRSTWNSKDLHVAIPMSHDFFDIFRRRLRLYVKSFDYWAGMLTVEFFDYNNFVVDIYDTYGNKMIEEEN